MSMKKIKQESDQYDLRAPPRRRQKGNSEDEQPVFLRKAFSMITTCPPEIGTVASKSLSSHFLK